MPIDVQTAMNDQAMRTYVVELVRRSVVSRGLPERPTWREAVAALGLPAVAFRTLPPEQDGMCVNRQIVISTRLTCLERIEFTVFHEVLHVLIDEDEDWEIGAQIRSFSGSLDDRQAHRLLEQLCQAGAAEFVVPAGPFASLARPDGWRVNTLGAAVDRFGCSAIAAAFQLAHSHPDPCTLVICEDGLLPAPAGRAGGLGERRCLHVAYSISNAKNKYPMCRHVPVPHRHLIHQAWLDASSAAGKDHGFFRDNLTWKMECEVTYLKGRAYALFLTRGRQAQAHDPLQQTLGF